MAEFSSYTPLQLAVAGGHLQCVNILIQAIVSRGLKVDIMAAIELGKNHKEIKDCLLDH